MFKKLATILTVLVLSLVLPVNVAFAQDSTTADEYEYLYTTQDIEDSIDQIYQTQGGEQLTDEEAAAAAAVGLLFSGVFLVVGGFFALVGYIYGALTLMAIAKKLNVENAWLAWVPLANLYLMAKCAGLSGWSALLVLVPLVNFIYLIYVFMRICERRGFSQWLGLLMIVPIGNLILLAVLAWGKSPTDK